MPEITTSLRIPNYASAPGSPLKGQMFINTTDNTLYYYNGTAWIQLSVGGGNVVASGVPTVNQLAVWTDATHIQGVADTTKQWDGGATGLTAATGRTSLALGSAALATGPSGAIVGTTDTQTLTNKNVTPRVLTISSAFATPTINTDNCDVVTITGLNTAITNMSTNLSGSPNNFDSLIIRIKDSGVQQTINWGTAFVFAGAFPPVLTFAGKAMTVHFLRDSVKGAWMCMSYDADGVSPYAAAASNNNNAALTANITFPGVHAGLPGAITPCVTGKLLVSVSGACYNNTANLGGQCALHYGTGGKPSQGVAATGTQLGNLISIGCPLANTAYPWSSLALISLTVGTAYWLDVCYNATGGGQFGLQNSGISILEVP